jgi:N-methylhydantoinase B
VIDPITLSVIRSSLVAVCDEMDMHLIRSALSPIISETNDCAHGIYDPRSGETIAQGRLGLPVFLANMQFVVQSTIAAAEQAGGFRRGDVWMMNDVYRGGTHLNDVNLVVPVFEGDEPIAIIANTGHFMDIGGGAPGGWNPDAREIHQEGLVIPPLRLYEVGVRNDAVVDLVMANVRLPAEMLGDLTAMSSAVRRGEERLRKVVERHGEEVVRTCLGELIERSEHEMRSHIEEIPDGDYEFTDQMDNDGVEDAPLPLRVRIGVRGGEMTIDFAGTSGAAKGPLNVPRVSTISLCYVALKHIFPTVPVNGGTFRPVSFEIPEGCLLAAEYPMPVSGYLETGGRVLEMVFGALAEAIPERVAAANFSTIGVTTVAGVHPDRGSYYVGAFPYPGGYGASHESDGLVHGTPPQSMANFVALEASEHRYPVTFEYFALREDSGGAGRHRGGDGSAYAIRCGAPLIVSVSGDRADLPPPGLFGGGPGAPNLVELTTAEGTWRPPMRAKLARFGAEPGDVVALASPGGGGFGEPGERRPEDVVRDLNLGYISRETASEVYGVAVVELPPLYGRPRYALAADAPARDAETAVVADG